MQPMTQIIDEFLLWFQYGFNTVCIYGFSVVGCCLRFLLMVLIWFCYGFDMVLLWFCEFCFIVFLWFFYGFFRVSQVCSMLLRFPAWFW